MAMKKESLTSLTQSGDFKGSKGTSLFTPVSRPFLKSIPEPASARRFLKAFELYSHELAHRRLNNQGGVQQLEPMHFCIHQNVLDWLIACKELTFDVETKLIPDQQLIDWLQAIIDDEDDRPLAEILARLQWPSTGSTLQHQAEIFQMETIVLLRDARARDMHDEKSIIKLLCSRLPRPLKLSALEYFAQGCLRGAEAKKNIKKFWKWLIDEAVKHDNTRRFYLQSAAMANKPPAQKANSSTSSAPPKPPNPPKGKGQGGGGHAGSQKAAAPAASVSTEDSGSKTTKKSRIYRECLGCKSEEHRFRDCPIITDPQERKRMYDDAVAARTSTTRSGAAFKATEKIQCMRIPSDSSPSSSVMQVRVGDTSIACHDDSGADRTILFSSLVADLLDQGAPLHLVKDTSKCFALADGTELCSTHRATLSLGLPATDAQSWVWLRDVTAFVVPGCNHVCLLGSPELRSLGVPSAQHVVDALVAEGVSSVDALPQPAPVQPSLQLLRVRAVTPTPSVSDCSAVSIAPELVEPEFDTMPGLVDFDTTSDEEMSDSDSEVDESVPVIPVFPPLEGAAPDVIVLHDVAHVPPDAMVWGFQAYDDSLVLRPARTVARAHGGGWRVCVDLDKVVAAPQPPFTSAVHTAAPTPVQVNWWADLLTRVFHGGGHRPPGWGVACAADMYYPARLPVVQLAPGLSLLLYATVPNGPAVYGWLAFTDAYSQYTYLAPCLPLRPESVDAATLAWCAFRSQAAPLLSQRFCPRLNGAVLPADDVVDGAGYEV